MTKLPVWTKFSFGIILLVTLGPWTSLLVNYVIPGGDFDFQLPSRIGSKECASLGIPNCKGAIYFGAKNFEKKAEAVFGVPTVESLLICKQKTGQIKTLVPTRKVGNIGVYSTPFECDGEIVASIDEKIPLPPASWIVPLAVSGESGKLNTYLKSVIFYTNDIRPFIAPMVFFQMFLILIIFQAFGVRQTFPYRTSLVVAALMAVLNSGIVERVISLNLVKVLPNIITFLAILWAVTFHIESRYSHFSKRRLYFAIQISFVITLLFAVGILPASALFVVLAAIWMFSGFVSKRKGIAVPLALINCTYLIPIFSQYSIFPLFAGSFFFLVICIGYQFEYIQFSLLEANLNRLSFKVLNERKLNFLFKFMSKSLGGCKVTIAYASNDQFKILCFTSKSQSPKAISTNEQPLIISRVFATGRALINVSENDEVGRDIANKGSKYNTNVFSAVPVIYNGEITAVICFTDYDRACKHSETQNLLGQAFLSFGQSVAIAIATLEQNRMTGLMTDVLNSVAIKSNTLDNCIDNLFECLLEKYNISAYFAEVDDEQCLKLVKASGSLLPMFDEINDQRFTITHENKFGALSIAMVENRVVVQQNWKLLGDRISVPAQNFYKRAKTNSIMTVPVRVSIGDTSFMYILWLQSDAQTIFSQSYADLGKRLGQFLETKIYSLLNEYTNQSLLELAKSDSVKALIRGKKTEVSERGWLLMVDLCNSTKIREKVSNTDYEVLISTYNSILEKFFSPRSFVKQMIIGDATILTKQDELGSGAFVADDLLEAMWQADQELGAFLKNMNVSTPIGPSFRVCAIYGDISRKIVSGPGGGWSIIGSTLSSVHKLEAACKSIRNGILFYSSNERIVTNVFSETTEVSLGSDSNLKVVTFESLADFSRKKVA